ncbi:MULTISPECIES: lipid-transfer protein [Sphingomonadales]|uniref:Lipid-transfer protein n=1 Tax=Rhizorhabdus wittichii TaxID=160791 RepID=A0A975D8E2_9SPHN|nr:MULTISPECIES: lipid-transfer protein [Sphingomonadaceae]QTH24846.1 lipid-transfer protein [Rhizorhabdus wittichii]QUM74444.1 lipid-transfer protein [Sphingopyxis granuli]
MLSDKTAIAGIGATEFSKNSGRSELRLASEAVCSALADAGIEASQVDGLCTMGADNTSEVEIARAIGAGELTFFSRIPFGGGGACAVVQQAALAVASGLASTVVCYRAMNERSQYRFGGPLPSAPTAEGEVTHYHTLHGLATAASFVAVMIRRYMHQYGATRQDFANVAIAARKHAAVNPAAFFYGKELTLDDYLGSRTISDPLHLYDCCMESDGAVALVVTSAERARDLKTKPVMVRAAAQGAARGNIPLMGFYGNDIIPFEDTRIVSEQLYAMGGLSAKDMDAAIIYDHFGPTILPALEASGFCNRGEAKDFIRDGNIEIGGGLPVNTHGGQVGEAYIHGMNGIAEAVRQVRGSAINQVVGLENILVTSGGGVPTSGLILGN